MAKRARYYCTNCHSEVISPKDIKKCNCLGKVSTESIDHGTLRVQSAHLRTRLLQSSTESLTDGIVDVEYWEEPLQTQVTLGEWFDVTGMYYWCPKREFDSVAVSSPDFAKFVTLKNHVIVCVFATKDSPKIGLENFVMPLRASNFHPSELKHIVLIGNANFLRKEWEKISNFPLISVITGSPMCRATLRAVRVDTCNTCVVLSAKTEYSPIDDPYLIDKEVILCSLNIKSMRFDDIQHLVHCNKSKCRTSLLTTTTVSPINKKIDGDLLPTLTPITCATTSQMEKRRLIGVDIDMISELQVDENVQFIEPEQEDPKCQIFETGAFACGTAFTASVLDSLVSTAYFNRNALTLIRALITGGATPELDMILSEGMGVQGIKVNHQVTINRNRSRMERLSLNDPVFNDLPENATVKDAYLKALEQSGILIIAVCRIKDHGRVETSVAPRRYVVLSPPGNFKLEPTDLFICLQPFHQNK